MHFQHVGSRDEGCHLHLGHVCPASLSASRSGVLRWLICCTPRAVPSTEGLTGLSLSFSPPRGLLQTHAAQCGPTVSSRGS